MFLKQYNAQLQLFNMGQWRTRKLFDGLNYGSKGENNERRRNWGLLPDS
jgi:hypothetical protein